MLNIKEDIISTIVKNEKHFDVKNSVAESEKIFAGYFDIKSEKISKSFNENSWSFKEILYDNTMHFEFDLFRPLIFFNKKINAPEFILALKCWVINNLNSMSPTTTYRQFRNLLSICHFTKGFNNDFQELIELVSNNQIYSKKNSSSTEYNIKTVVSDTTRRYINSLINFYRFYLHLPIDNEIINNLASVAEKLKASKLNRDLPNLTEFLNFKTCLESFFNNLEEDKFENTSDLIKYYPLIIWWEITTIIPMRPSEFCLIQRKCLSPKNELTFPRIKQRRNKAEARESIQYDTLPIPESIAKKIKHYIELTNKFDKTDRLISMQAFVSHSLKTKKKNVDYEKKEFTKVHLDKLIHHFYQDIIKRKYKLDFTDQITSGDMRHIAIISLISQGYDRVEIERLAGHYAINTQYSYVDHIHYFVDTEIQILSNEFALQSDVGFISPEAIEIYDNMQEEILYLELKEKRTKQDEYIELKLGYCKDKSMPCPTFNWNLTGCYFCTNWGITFRELQSNRELIVNEISFIYNELHRKINFLAGLYNLHQFDEFGNFNPNYKTQLRLTAEEIQNDKKILGKLRYLLGVEENE